MYFVHPSTDVEYRSICRPVYRSRGAQNTHDPSPICMQRTLIFAWSRILRLLTILCIEEIDIGLGQIIEQMVELLFIFEIQCKSACY